MYRLSLYVGRLITLHAAYTDGVEAFEFQPYDATYTYRRQQNIIYFLLVGFRWVLFDEGAHLTLKTLILESHELDGGLTAMRVYY